MKTTRNYRRMVSAAMAAMICFGSVISPANTRHTAGTEITASAVKAGISQQDAVNWAKARVAGIHGGTGRGRMPWCDC